MRNLLLSLIVLLFFACNADSQKGNTTSKSSKTKSVSEGGKEYVITSTGKKVEKAERGITVVYPDGWSKDQMEFQLRYCESSFDQMTHADGAVFCPCFLEKIQYFYEPIYAREAYEDQKKWNKECYEASIIGDTEVQSLPPSSN